MEKFSAYNKQYINVLARIAEHSCFFLCHRINGLTLDQFLSRHPDYFGQHENIRKFLRQLCQALQEMHRHQAASMRWGESSRSASPLTCSVAVPSSGKSPSLPIDGTFHVQAKIS